MLKAGGGHRLFLICSGLAQIVKLLPYKRGSDIKIPDSPLFPLTLDCDPFEFLHLISSCFLSVWGYVLYEVATWGGGWQPPVFLGCRALELSNPLETGFEFIAWSLSPAKWQMLVWSLWHPRTKSPGCLLAPLRAGVQAWGTLCPPEMMWLHGRSGWLS